MYDLRFWLSIVNVCLVVIFAIAILRSLYLDDGIKFKRARYFGIIYFLLHIPFFCIYPPKNFIDPFLASFFGLSLFLLTHYIPEGIYVIKKKIKENKNISKTQLKSENNNLALGTTGGGQAFNDKEMVLNELKNEKK